VGTSAHRKSYENARDEEAHAILNANPSGILASDLQTRASKKLLCRATVGNGLSRCRMLLYLHRIQKTKTLPKTQDE
jgi:hypothetical protein